MTSLGKRRTVAILLLGLLLLAACTSLQHLSELSDDLQRDGYRNISVQHNTTNGYDTLSVAAVSDTAPRPITHDAGLPLARIVWNSYQEHIDELRINLNGEGIRYPRAELEQEFGPRQPGLESAGGGRSTNIALYLLLGILIGAAIIVTVILLNRRSRRRRPPRQDPPYPSVYPSAPPA